MLHVATKAELRAACNGARARGTTVGLVPTMGYLHEGHRSLVRRAGEECGFVVVTIFVNPLQFGAGEDLDRYPRDLAGDLAACREEGVACVFTPSVTEMYPAPTRTTVHVSGLTECLCGVARPTHFDGVTTVVAKLFSLAGPCRAYFGRKDAQQLAAIERMTADLDLPVEVVGCPLVREPDGLARSSRNAYLSADERRAAPVLFAGLRTAAEAAIAGTADTAALLERARAVVTSEPLVALEYLEARDAYDLTPVARVQGDVLVALAARLGTTRLIDNVRLSARDGIVTADLGTGWTPGDGKERPCNAP